MPGGSGSSAALRRIKTADWVLDLGPEGGEIVAQGTPEVVAKAKGSFAARYLAPVLEQRRGNEPILSDADAEAAAQLSE